MAIMPSGTRAAAAYLKNVRVFCFFSSPSRAFFSPPAKKNSAAMQ